MWPIHQIIERTCLRVYPGLKNDLYRAGMRESVPKFITLAVLLGFIITTIFAMPTAWILILFGLPWWSGLIVAALLLPLMFLIALHIPQFNVARISQQTNAEVAVMGRRLLIELESGKSLVNALIDIGTKQTSQGNPLSRIAYQLTMGKPLEETIDDAIEDTESAVLKRILLQIRNSLRTGTDLKHTLKVTLEDITRQKIVEFESFGKKLNSMGLFYMIFGTILPSLGAVVYVFTLAALGIQISLLQLSLFLLLVIPVQFLFIVVFSKMRPELQL